VKSSTESLIRPDSNGAVGATELASSLLLL
jgi:hypothetical protein